ncbi:hypothetical protein LSTR_LSTR009711 [Laodelphax striatellus]|uniref:Uncharacterized protein n=1 Tax=Laodelphax striatellus TaxID=195883 RepID=A0A482WX50_LAOST|nr:hypothetical protein LSTR_LSTR009711 [Laodelphax striatellus]
MALKSTLIVLTAVAQLSTFCQAQTLDCGCSVPRIYSVGDCCNGLRKTVIVKNDQPCCSSGFGTCGCGTCGCNKKSGDTIVIKEPSTCCGASPAVVGPYYGGLNSYYGGYGPYGCGSACGNAAGYPYTYGYNGCGSGYGYGSSCGCGCGCGSTCGCRCSSTCGKTCGDTIVIKEPTCRCSAC